MSNQLVMYEEELSQISNICDVLQRDSNAKAVLVIDKNGQAIAQSGEVEQLDVTSLSSDRRQHRRDRRHRVSCWVRKSSRSSSTRASATTSTSRSSASESSS
jgi:hypothetical protein